MRTPRPDAPCGFCAHPLRYHLAEGCDRKGCECVAWRRGCAIGDTPYVWHNMAQSDLERSVRIIAGQEAEAALRRVFTLEQLET